MFIVNQMDREHANFEKVVAQLREKYGSSVVPILLPLGQGANFRGVVNLLERKAYEGDADALIEKIRKALYASKIISYAQGYSLMRAAAEHYGWNLNFGGIALMWRGGCIIRSAFLGKIKEAFEKDPALSNLILDSYFADQMKTLVPALREVVAFAVGAGIPVPSLSSALSWFDGYTTERLPANLLQAQRDYFGAHTYERTDAPRGEHFHTNWTGHGGDTSSSSYNA
jgi:6-phosphogluconate dehydrogenase